MTDGRLGEPVAKSGPPPADPVKRPICDPCVDELEAKRAQAGLPALWPLRTEMIAAGTWYRVQ